jgi:KipI family sensor histidine kinase inhibitor
VTLRILPARDDAVLVELADLDETLALVASLDAEPIAGVVDLVPGARTLLVMFRPSAVSAAELAAELRSRPLDRVGSVDAPLRRVPVRYDGEDLAEVAGLLGMTPDEVVRRHTAAEYTVAFVGFAPGFAYLTGGDPLFDVPRRSSPRTRIPAGSVALAGTYSGVYPRESPGGWQLIGTTELPMWDLGRERPAYLEPGDRVRFDLADASRPSVIVADQTPDAAAPVAHDGPALEVLAAGLQTVFQDLGRVGFTSMGVSRSGALDAPSLRAANRLVGNDPAEAALEVVVGGLQVRAHGPQVVAVCGAPAPLTVLRSNGTSHEGAFHTAIALDDGDELQLGFAPEGVRSYLAVRGGFAEPPVLGSLATDALSGVGPQVIASGRVLGVRPAGSAAVALEDAPTARLPRPGEETVLDIVLGPRTDWLTADAVRALTSQAWDVTPQSNRIGVRLSGQPIQRQRTDELPSEGCVAGALQIPPNGQPVLFLADHPLTGGYPVIGAIASDQLALAGQLPVGALVRFRVRAPLVELGADRAFDESAQSDNPAGEEAP